MSELLVLKGVLPQNGHMQSTEHESGIAPWNCMLSKGGWTCSSLARLSSR